MACRCAIGSTSSRSSRRRDGQPRTRERLELLSNLVSIAEALAYAHERRVVHRDCHAEQHPARQARRGDADRLGHRARSRCAGGAASRRCSDDDPSMSGRMVTISAGTPPYMPLEQSQGRTADPSFDVYSFGITLYEVVSGRTPFEWQTGALGRRHDRADRRVPRRGCSRDDPVPAGDAARSASCRESSRARWRATRRSGSPPTSWSARSSST